MRIIKNLKFFVILISLLLISNSYTEDEKEKVICIEAEGEEYFSELDYKKDVIKRAKNDAIRKAIEEAYGVFIKSKTIVHNEMLLDDLIEKFVRGKKIKEEVISENCDRVNDMCQVKMI